VQAKALIVALDHSWINRGSRSMRMSDRKRFEGLESIILVLSD
jgi:hypothetical protein